ncbi:hypothetical protein ACWCXH_15995 [Kitasatospora sp. NPDC001660]
MAAVITGGPATLAVAAPAHPASAAVAANRDAAAEEQWPADLDDGHAGRMS